jgi:hypothetical protein
MRRSIVMCDVIYIVYTGGICSSESSSADRDRCDGVGCGEA